ncbi:MAG: DUF302 domain-containing protein [Pseudomonadota bacterium]
MKAAARLAAAAWLFVVSPVLAQDVADLAPREGWAVHVTDHDFDDLVAHTRAAIGDGGLAVVTQAGPTGAAANRGIDIPGNRIIGAFNNVFAVRILSLSTAAMIEAPLRFYVTENANGTATLSYKEPSFVFAPYIAEGGDDLIAAAAELDAIFAAIAEDAASR